MTTKVTVHANHGWPVDVSLVSVNGSTVQRVQPGEIMDFYVYDGRDLCIHEVQPDEIDADRTRA